MFLVLQNIFFFWFMMMEGTYLRPIKLVWGRYLMLGWLVTNSVTNSEKLGKANLYEKFSKEGRK